MTNEKLMSPTVGSGVLARANGWAERIRHRSVLLLSLAALAAFATILFATAKSNAQEPAACLSSDPNAWPPASKPYFMIAFDTSGSMATAVTGAAPSCSGFPSNRIGHGRCALRNTALAFSEVNFGLASFASRNTCNQNPAVAGNCDNDAMCGDEEYPPGNDNDCGPFLNEPTLGVNVHSGGHVVVPLLQDHYWSQPPDPTNVPSILQMADDTCGVNNGFANGGGEWNSELGSGGNTPLGGILFDLNRYFAGTYVDKWAGGSPLPSPIGPQPEERACRSINIILITDGDETCDAGINPTPVPGGCRAGQANYLNNSGERLASYEADRLFTTGITIDGQNFKIRTHVIAFTGADITAANHIATCGGTGTAYSTANEQQLSQALSNIVAGAIRPEVCNNTDDNCNGCTDEGYKHHCNRRPTCCAWTNPTQRNACLTSYTNSLATSPPDGNLNLLPCTTPAQQTQPAAWLCFDPKEVCDDVDNNCNAQTDEGFNKCGTPLACPAAETCDGQDDDCDNIIDNAPGNPTPFSLPGCTPCVPSQEICDGCDQDCDSIADNGVGSVPCGFSPPAQCAGTQSCGAPIAVAGPNLCAPGHPQSRFGACNNNPGTETCNGTDDDCDGQIDDGVPPVPCDVPGQPGLVYKSTFAASQCVRGQLPCNGTCTGWIGPSPEICDGIDNDCDGVVDDNVPNVGIPCGSAVGQCRRGNTACVAGVLVCQGGQPPQPEVCNGLDDDCDGTTDDAPLGDAPPAGQQGCWGLPPTGCNPICTQNNADPTIPDLRWCPPPNGVCRGVGTLSAPCQTGSLACDGTNGWKCVGGTVPVPEVCDNVDNNCNNNTDEGVPGVGQECGSDVGVCEKGNTQCQGGSIVCVGEVGPSEEICDTLDNNCNGVTNEGIPIGDACVPPHDETLYPGDRTKGECVPGVLECDQSGNQVCTGGTGPVPEICDGKDNDCDGQVDEAGPPPDGIDGTSDPDDPSRTLGDPCGVDEGECVRGQLACVNGQVACTGTVGPQPELCDCLDNDCNGNIDNQPADGGTPLCTGEKKCAAVAPGVCQCAGPCSAGEFPCPTGSECQEVPISGSNERERLCVNDPCGDCATKTVTNQQTSEVECAPSGTVPECVCKGNAGCRSPCFGISCPSGQSCATQGPAAGTCQPQNNCNFFGCSSGEVCNNGACVDDPCDPNTCPAGEVCKPNADFGDKRCVKSCAGVDCPAGEACVEGTCTPTGCGQDCPAGEFCQPNGDAGSACGPSKCQTDAGLACSDGRYCDPVTGGCINDPCTGIKCPTAQLCVNGECDWAPEGGAGVGGTGGTGATGGTSAGGSSGSAGSSGSGASSGSTSTGGSGTTPAEPTGVWGLATGGGGCACRAAGEPRNLNAAGIALLGLALSAIGLRRTRRRRTDASCTVKGAAR